MSTTSTYLLGLLETAAGEEVAIIPASWKHKSNSCLYPKHKDVTKTRAAVKKGKGPEKGWQSFGFRVLGTYGMVILTKLGIFPCLKFWYFLYQPCFILACNYLFAFLNTGFIDLCYSHFVALYCHRRSSCATSA